jgi:hypothetical protein
METILTTSTDFGNTRYEQTMATFTIKTILLFIPGILLGHYTDRFVKKIQEKEMLGRGLYKYLLVQLFLNILVIYTVILMSSAYAKEFQTTIAGLFFVSMFFSLQSNFVKNIQDFL